MARAQKLTVRLLVGRDFMEPAGGFEQLAGAWAVGWANQAIPLHQINEMGSRYLFICLYLWLEKYLSRGDYKKHPSA